MRALVIGALFVALAGTTASAQSKNLAGMNTVEQWRRNAELGGYTYRLGYAEGAFVQSNIWFECTMPKTVGELMAYLQHRAVPTLSMQAALLAYHLESGCQLKTELIDYVRSQPKFE